MAMSIIIKGPFSFVDESVRWLVGKGEVEKSVKILRKIARINRKEVKEEVYDNFKVLRALYVPGQESITHNV